MPGTCPFPYFKKPATVKEAQSNLNYWHWVMLGGCPEGAIEANWRTYIREMTRSAQRDMQKLKDATNA